MLRLAVFALLVAAAAAASVATGVTIREVNPMLKATPGTNDAVEDLVSCGSKGTLVSVTVDRCMHDLHIGNVYTFDTRFKVLSSHSTLTFTISLFANNEETVLYNVSVAYAYIAGASYGVDLPAGIPDFLPEGDVFIRFKISDAGVDEVCSLAPAVFHHST